MIHTEKVDYLTIEIDYDTDVPSPREDDCFGHMICFHSRRNLGDENNFKTPQEVDLFMKKNNCYHLPVFLYDHSGLTISTKPFSCPWDSGQVGVIYVSKDDIKKEFGEGPDATEKAKNSLIAEVKAYDQYLSGEYYYYQIEDEEGQILESCYGMDDLDYCKTEAVKTAKGVVKSEKQELATTLSNGQIIQIRG